MPILNHLAKKVKHKIRNTVNTLVSNEQDENEAEYLYEGNRFDSFAPIRQNAMVKFFIDGHDYCW